MERGYKFEKAKYVSQEEFKKLTQNQIDATAQKRAKIMGEMKKRGYFDRDGK